MTEFKNYPLAEIAKTVAELIIKGADVYQKYTCAGCGARLTMPVPNTLFTEGTCDKCDAITDIRKDGCNYLLTWSGSMDEISAALKGESDDQVSETGQERKDER